MTNNWEKSPKATDFRMLLRNPEDTLREREDRGERPIFIHEKNNSGEIVTMGVPHSINPETINGYKDLIREKHPDIMLAEADVVVVEGGAIPDIDPETDPSEVIKKYGEQTYFAWLAQKLGTPVRYWDLNFEGKFKAAIENHSVNDVLGWLTGAALKVLFESRAIEGATAPDKIREIDIENLKSIFKRYVTPELARYVLEKTGVNLKADEIDFNNLCLSYCQKPLTEMTFNDVVKLSDPYLEGPTNIVVRDLNKIRDERAVTLIEELKTKYKFIFVTAGLDHVITWEPAIEQLYAKNQNLT